jgi:hypothetical protein
MAFNAHIPQGLKPAAKLPKAPGRFLNKASHKMETKQAMGKYRVPAAARALGAPRHGASPSAPRHQPSGPAHAGPAPQSPLEMNPAQLHAYNTAQVKQNTQAELLPFRQKSAELNNQEQTTANRYAGYAQATQSQLGGLQEGQAASAKTATNEAAESALRASKAIETTGQSSAQQNAGYVDPQVKAALSNQQGNVQATGQAREAGAAAMNQNEANFLTNLRAAAAQRATEGMQGIASTYGKQRGEVGGQERQALARMPGQISKLDTEGLQRQFNDRATEQGLGIKIQTLGQKAQETQARLNVTKRGQNLTAQSQAEARKQKGEEHKGSLALGLKNYYLNKEKADKGTTPAGTKPLTTNERNKYIEALTGAYKLTQAARSGPNKTGYDAIRHVLESGEHKESYKTKNEYGEEQTKTRVVKKGKTATPIATAASELWNTHKVSGSTRQALKNLGVELPSDKELFSMASGVR